MANSRRLMLETLIAFVNVVHYANGVHCCQGCSRRTDRGRGRCRSAVRGRGNRRERLRDATTAEIKDTARALLVEAGPDACTLRAIAREMGMTAPALYRYFGSHEELVAALYQDLLTEITVTLEQARDTVGDGGPGGSADGGLPGVPSVVAGEPAGVPAGLRLGRRGGAARPRPARLGPVVRRGVPRGVRRDLAGPAVRRTRGRRPAERPGRAAAHLLRRVSATCSRSASWRRTCPAGSGSTAR